MDDLRARLEELAGVMTAQAQPPPAAVVVLRRARRRAVAVRTAAAVTVLVVIGLAVAAPRIGLTRPGPAARPTTSATTVPGGPGRGAAAIAVWPPEGPPGTLITISGPGCHPFNWSGGSAHGWSPWWSTRMELHLNHLYGQGGVKPWVMEEVAVTPGPDGRWQAAYRVPQYLPPQSYELTVVCWEGSSTWRPLPGKPTFTVTRPPAAQPASGWITPGLAALGSGMLAALGGWRLYRRRHPAGLSPSRQGRSPMAH